LTALGSQTREKQTRKNSWSAALASTGEWPVAGGHHPCLPVGVITGDVTALIAVLIHFVISCAQLLTLRNLKQREPLFEAQAFRANKG